MKPHVHKDVMIAAANGATVQCKSPEGWVDIKNACYIDTCEYRVKPDREYPVTSMSDDDLIAIHHSHPGDQKAFLRYVCNEAIKRYIQDQES